MARQKVAIRPITPEEQQRRDNHAARMKEMGLKRKAEQEGWPRVDRNATWESLMRGRKYDRGGADK